MIIKKIRAILFLILLISNSSLHAARILIFSDIHGDVDYFRKVISHMKATKPTHIIANGDFVSFDVNWDLLNIFNLIQVLKKRTGIPPENLFILPGNWEHTLNIRPMEINQKLRSFGKLVSTKYHRNGFINIREGKKIFRIWVGHFPQFIIPSQAIPPERFLYSLLDNQAHILVTMNRRTPIPLNADLVIFSHTHIRASFFDKNTGTLVINPGGLDLERKSPQEICSFALFDTSGIGKVSFYNANNGSLIAQYPLRDPNKIYKHLHYDTSTWKTADNNKGNIGRIYKFLKYYYEELPRERTIIKWNP